VRKLLGTVIGVSLLACAGCGANGDEERALKDSAYRCVYRTVARDMESPDSAWAICAVGRSSDAERKALREAVECINREGWRSGTGRWRRACKTSPFAD
jgi:hypothetical protein